MENINKTQSTRWFVIQDAVSGEPGIIVFGICDIGLELETGQPNLTVYLTEDELETAVNTITGVSDYYKDAVEGNSLKFQGESVKFT